MVRKKEISSWSYSLKLYAWTIFIFPILLSLYVFFLKEWDPAIQSKLHSTSFLLVFMLLIVYSALHLLVVILPVYMAHSFLMLKTGWTKFEYKFYLALVNTVAVSLGLLLLIDFGVVNDFYDRLEASVIWVFYTAVFVSTFLVNPNQYRMTTGLRWIDDI